MLSQDFMAILVPRRSHFILQLCICGFPIAYVWIGVNDLLGHYRLRVVLVWTENFVYVYQRKRIRVDGTSIEERSKGKHRNVYILIRGYTPKFGRGVRDHLP